MTYHGKGEFCGYPASFEDSMFAPTATGNGAPAYDDVIIWSVAGAESAGKDLDGVGK